MKKTLTVKDVKNAASFRVAALMPLLLLAACQGTLHSRWANQSDSYKDWKPQMAAMPIEVHGTVPGSDAARTMASIPGGTDATAYAASRSDANALSSASRIVLYVGGNQLPTNDTYCQATPVMRTAEVPAGKLMFATALCDGPRLVITARREVAPDEAGESTMAHTIHGIKNFMLYGVSSSRAQPELKFACTNDSAGQC